MKYNAVTIKDIAQELGVSTSTVSRALRDSYEISPETKKAVMECANRLNYHPNPIALSLRGKTSKTIGIIVSEIANSFFSQVINGIESLANEHEYNVVIVQTHESFDKELRALQYLASRSIDGLIISVSTETGKVDHLQELHRKGFPLVFCDRVIDSIATHSVVADNFQGAHDATKHLIENGYKNIAHIANASNLSITIERLSGYRAALLNGGLAINPSQIQYCQHGGMIEGEVEDAIRKLMEGDTPPDAIFSAGDRLTIGCLKYFKKAGIKIPGDIGIAGFSNSELSDLIDPPLTVVRQPAFEMGRKATEFLLDMIDGQQTSPGYQRHTLPSNLIIKASSSPFPSLQTKG